MISEKSLLEGDLSEKGPPKRKNEQDPPKKRKNNPNLNSPKIDDESLIEEPRQIGSISKKSPFEIIQKIIYF